MITIDEKIFHPGHYRIALAANDPSELPAEPVVTAGSTPCGSVPVQSPPVYPVLADGVFDHSSPFSAPQSVKVTLPPGVTCTKCTLQVIEFMSNHPLNNPGGCFYHHCADISIGAGAGGGDAGGVGDDGGGAGGDASTNASPPAPSSGCASAPGRATTTVAWALLGLFAAVALLRGRRRR